MTKTLERSDAQRALVEMRRLLGYTQQQLAEELGCSLIALARWETSREPRGTAAFTLQQFAEQHQMPDLAARFRLAQRKEIDWDLEKIPGAAELSRPLVDLLCNRHIPGVAEACRSLAKEMLKGYRVLSKAQRSGMRIKSPHADRDDYSAEALSLAAHSLPQLKQQALEFRQQTELTPQDVGYRQSELEAYIAEDLKPKGRKK